MNNNWLIPLIAVGVFLVYLVYFFIRRKSTKKQKAEKEDKTSAMIDQMSMRRAAINTAYLEKDFNQSIQSLVYAFYSQNPQFLPTQNIMPDLYKEWYDKMKREYDLGIQKQLYNFNMVKSRVCKQENSSMYAVTHIEMEAEFSIDFLYSHATMNKRTARSFKQRFVFLNTNNAWYLEKALPETDVEEQELPIN